MKKHFASLCPLSFWVGFSFIVSFLFSSLSPSLLGQNNSTSSKTPSTSTPTNSTSSQNINLNAPNLNPQQNNNKKDPVDPTEKSRRGPTIMGQEIPLFDPSNDTVTFDGKTWNASNNRLFRARFEKFLNAKGQQDDDYQKIMQKIMSILTPNNVKPDAVDEAWSLLPQASNYSIDANLCDSIANAVYTVWSINKENRRLEKAQRALKKQRDHAEWNAKVDIKDESINRVSSDPTKQAAYEKQKELERQMRMQPHARRLTEINMMIGANRLKRESSELQAKLQFQALSLQLFTQRRFQHVLMANRFYRLVFQDGDTQLRVGDETEKLLTKGTGLPPTINLLDTLAKEAIRDTEESVEAYRFLLSKKELYSATERLAEAFAIGEYLPALRSLSREEKRQAHDFTLKSNKLLSALEIKDYTLAEQMVQEIEKVAQDFDTSKAKGAIETARTLCSMHLAKAKTAAVSGDREILEEELKKATAIWPRNPELAKVSSAIFAQTDVQQQALIDLERLISQKNYRQVFEDRVRFIAATALYPDKQEKLRKVLDSMQMVESAIIRASEISKYGDHAGAWETVERAYQKFPDDTKLNQVRADYTTEAADFVRSLRNAERLKEKKIFGSSLSWYLKAQSLYPNSEFAKEGINSIVAEIFPQPDSLNEDSEAKVEDKTPESQPTEKTSS